MTLLVKQSAGDKQRLEGQLAVLEGQRKKDQAEIASLKKAAAASSATGGASTTSSAVPPVSTTPTAPAVRSFAMADLESRAKLDREEIVTLRR